MFGWEWKSGGMKEVSLYKFTHYACYKWCPIKTKKVTNNQKKKKKKAKEKEKKKKEQRTVNQKEKKKKKRKE